MDNLRLLWKQESLFTLGSYLIFVPENRKTSILFGLLWRFQCLRIVLIAVASAYWVSVSLAAQNGENDPRLVADYYTKSWGVPVRATVQAILKKDQPDQQDLALLLKALSNSSPQKLRNIDTSISGFSKKNPKSDSIELLLDLKAEILEQRTLIKSYIFTRIDEKQYSDILADLLNTFIQTAANEEDIQNLLVRFKLLSGFNNDKATVLCFQIVDLALRNRLLDEMSAERYPDVVGFLREQSAANGPGNFLSTQATGMLVRVGGSDANAMLRQLLDNSLNPASTVTDLSSNVSAFLTMATVNPRLGSQYLGEIDRLGEIIAQTQHEKLMQAFAKNVRLLGEAFKRTGDTKSLAALVGYLEREKANRSHPSMAGYAAAALTQMEQ